MAEIQVPEVYAARTNVGCVREHNEDSFVAKSPLFVVADGMGGHESGEVASEIAVNTLLEKAPDGPDGEALTNAVRDANTAILRGVADGIGRVGMGTTITAAQVFDDQLLVAQVGDSRAYLLHDGTLQRITRDHSLVADLVEMGRITEEQARTHPQRSVITRALGSDISVEPDLYILRVHEGDRVMLCSDGLCGMISDAHIKELLADFPDPEKCCDALIKAALDAGGNDNVTCVIIDPLKKMPKSTSHAEERKISTKAKRNLAPIITAVAIVAALALACVGIFAYAKHSYYVVDEGGYVSVYQGVPGSVAGIKLSWLQETTDIPVAQLAPSTANRLEEGQTVSTLDDAHKLLDDYRSYITSHSLTEDDGSQAESDK